MSKSKVQSQSGHTHLHSCSRAGNSQQVQKNTYLTSNHSEYISLEMLWFTRSHWSSLSCLTILIFHKSKYRSRIHIQNSSTIFLNWGPYIHFLTIYRYLQNGQVFLTCSKDDWIPKSQNENQALLRTTSVWGIRKQSNPTKLPGTSEITQTTLSSNRQHLWIQGFKGHLQL